MQFFLVMFSKEIKNEKLQLWGFFLMHWNNEKIDKNSGVIKETVEILLGNIGFQCFASF